MAGGSIFAIESKVINMKLYHKHLVFSAAYVIVMYQMSQKG
jgi:hypothetical protein